MTLPPPRDDVARYHERSTHHPGRFAPGPGFLDWANQPEPFRSYAGAPRLELPLASDERSASWGDIHRPGAVPPHRLDRARLGAFLELALGITAWKEHGGSRWALRANPSSGNLHPTEGYVLVGAAEAVPAGLHHYLSRDHALERRWAPSSAAAAILAQILGDGTFLVGLSSIHWREAWKYGERAFRYCQHDAGHALGAVRYAAAVLGWSTRLLETPGDADVSALLGLEREDDFDPLHPDDRERPDALVVVGPADRVEDDRRRLERDLDGLLALLGNGERTGRPNALGSSHVEWPAIAQVAAATAKPRTPTLPDPVLPRDLDATGPEGSTARPGDALPAVRLVRQRRSAVDMDGTTGATRDAFFAILARLLPGPGTPPFDTLPWAPRVHLLLFVHRVEGLPRGLYLLVRDPEAAETLRGALRSSFAWTRPTAGPESLPLFLLEEGDSRSFARLASCQQAIASDSAFSLGMLADFDGSLREGGWWYRRLHWEAGMIGQALYLEAEAAGLRGTGIGCYFDDVVHETLGLADGRFRDLYHFTVGGAVEDDRLATRPAYAEDVTRRS